MKFNSKAYDELYPRQEKTIIEQVPEEDKMVSSVTEEKSEEKIEEKVEVIEDGNPRPDEPTAEQ